MLSTIAEAIRDLLIFVGVIAVLPIALVVVVSKMPNTNPLKRVLMALCYRLGCHIGARCSKLANYSLRFTAGLQRGSTRVI